MFLDMTLKRNPNLIETAVKLHRAGIIRPNTYLIDIDTVRKNVRTLVKAARESQITLYMMTKQIGRNPDLARIIAECGITRAVAVDPWEAIILHQAGIKIGNVGHLVQIPSSFIQEILALAPETVTVFSTEKAREISDVAVKLGCKQNLLLKVMGPQDKVYEGQLGGFREDDLINEAKAIMKLPGVRIVGLTSFPCFLYDAKEGIVKQTENINTIIRCASLLRSKLGLTLEQINTPSVNMVSTFPLMHKLGATHGEPGHSITGTTPIHGYREMPEIPAIVYVTEVSHLYEDKAYTFGGGFYKRSQVKKAMVGTAFEVMRDNMLEAEEISAESIDYYGTLRIGPNRAKVGDTAVYAFRTQIFVTRSEVALVEGVSTGVPRIIGFYDGQGRRIN